MFNMRFNRKIAMLTVLAMLLSLVPGILVSGYSSGISFKIYSNPEYAGNSTYGKSYIWALAPDAMISGNPGSTSVNAMYFSAGDGIIHEPTTGSLDGVSTKITVSHKKSYTEMYLGKLLARDSDLAAVVTYVEDGVVKKSPAFRFTGFHYNGKQGHDPSENGEVVTYEIGTYPNVVNVNVYHILSSPTDTTNHLQNSTPYHEYVQFDVVGEAEEAILPEAGTYYIEKDVLPNADKGVPMATPVPTAETPIGGVDAEPYITPQPIVTDSPVVPFGLGTRFTLFPEDREGLGDLSVNAAPILNRDYGTVTYEIPEGGKVTAFSAYGILNSSTQGAAGIKAIFTPTAGRLDGVVTEVTAFQCFFGGGPVPKAIVKYDGGKEETVEYMPDSIDMTYFYNLMLPIGTYKNLESVTIITTGTQEREIPSLEFRVVNEYPDMPAPELPKKTYTAPNIPTVTPKPVTTIPVPTVDSPLSINEAVSDNKTGYTDQYGTHPDWIEIYNNSDSDIDISGYGLTDSVKKPYKWTFPLNTVVPAKGYLVVMASSADAVINGEIHTNFSISKAGETLMLSNTAGDVLSVMDMPALDEDYAIARVGDGSNNLKIVKPTFGASNNESESEGIVISKPEFSAQSGFYNEAFDLTITGQGGKVYYTLDGSTPTAESTEYTGPINIYNKTNEPNVLSAMTYNVGLAYNPCAVVPSGKVDKSMVVRAVVIDDEGNSSEVVTKSYFVGFDMAKDFNNAMVISMTTDADGLFDENYGIFPNVDEQRREFERRVHLDIFDRDGSLAIDQDAGVRTRGFGYKYKEQKGMNLHARSEYGESKFKYPLFENSYSKVDGSLVQEYKSVALRHGSSNYNLFRFKDGQAQALSGETGTAYQAQRPVVLFINGEYWGVYYMAERATDDYIEEHYGIPKEDVIIIKNHMNTGDGTAADRQLYNDEKVWLSTTDFTIPENYRQLTAKYDLENLMLFYAANINLLSGDWIGYNFCTWRSRYITDRPYEDGKWRFMMYDVDSAYNGSYNMSDYFNGKDRAWGVALLNNPSLKKIFCNIMQDTYYNTYSPELVYEDFEVWYRDYYPLLAKQGARWNLSTTQAGEMTANYQVLMMMRSSHIDDIKRQFGLSGDYAYLNVRSNNAGGRVRVNYRDVDFSNCSYSTYNYTDYTSTLEAIPNPGYAFVGWTASEGTSLSSDSDTTTHVTLATNGSQVVAHFESLSGIKGSGTVIDPFVISTEEDLNWMSETVNANNSAFGSKYYVLANDIEVSGDYTAIGDINNPFNGTFDGQGFTVSGININNTTQGQGLFGYVGEKGTVKNVGVNITVNGGKNVGGIVGNNAGTIENCYSLGSLYGTSTVGGITGNNSGGKVINCYSTASVTADSVSTLSGIAGKTELGGTVVNCYSLIEPVAKNDGGRVDELTSVKTEEEFKNNSVAYALNEFGEKSVWASGENSPVFATETNKAITVKVTFMEDNTADRYAYTYAGGTVNVPDGNWLKDGEAFTNSTVVNESVYVIKEGSTVTPPTPTPVPTTEPTATPKPTAEPTATPAATAKPTAVPIVTTAPDGGNSEPKPTAPAGTKVVEVTTYDELKAAMMATVEGETEENPTVVVLKADAVATSSIELSGTPKYKVLVADADCTITREQGTESEGGGFTDNILKITNGSVVTLGGLDDYNGVITFDGSNPYGKAWPWSTVGITESIVYVSTEATFNMYSGVLTSSKVDGGKGTIKLDNATANLYGGIICNTSTANQWCEGGAIYMENADLLIDGVNIVNNSAGSGSAVRCNRGNVVMKSGYISGNSSNNIIDIASNVEGSEASFTMYGGVIENNNETNAVIHLAELTTGHFYGGTIRNTTKTAIYLKSAGTNYASVVFASANGNKGILMENCGYDGSTVTSATGGCIFNDNGCTTTIFAGTFKNSRSNYNNGGFVQNAGYLNLLGGNVEGCDIAVKHDGLGLSMSGDVRFSPADYINLCGDKTIDVIGDITTNGAAATIRGDYVSIGKLVLTGDYAADNADKFAALVNGTMYGVNTEGCVDDSVTAPEFVEGEFVPSIVLSYSDGTAVINSNVAIESARFIIASYDENGFLLDIEIIPATVEANVEFKEELVNFDEGSEMKLMLLNTLDDIRPIVNVVEY